MNTLMRITRPETAMADLFDNLASDGIFSWMDRDIATTGRWPRVDIIEHDDAYRLHADLPGLNKDDIKVTVENGVLTISGEKKEEKHEGKESNYRYYERSYGSFSRSFNLPDNIDAANVGASYKDGVLELTLRKTEAAKPKAIEVKVA